MPNCHVFVDGNRLALEDEARLVSVDVDLDGELFGRCEVSFHDPSLKLIDGRQFQGGAAFQIDLGFGSRLSRIFDGEVVCLEPRFRRDVAPALHVICYERLHRLALSPATRAFNNVDDDEIVKNVARDHGLTGEAPTGSKSHILQSNVTDAVLLRRIAQKDGNRVRLDGKKIVVAAPSTSSQVVIAPGDGLKKVKVRINALSQVEEVTVHGWDPQARQEIVGKAKAAGGQRDEGARKYGAGKTLSIAGHEHAPTDTATADRMAKGRLQKVVLSTSESFEAAGTGTFTRSNDSIKFFRSADKDDEIKFDGKDNVFKGSQLSAGVALYAEGAKPSAALEDIQLALRLAGGSKTIGAAAVCKATSVEVTLDVCKGRPSAGGDPPPLSQGDKIAVGRNL